MLRPDPSVRTRVILVFRVITGRNRCSIPLPVRLEPANALRPLETSPAGWPYNFHLHRQQEDEWITPSSAVEASLGLHGERGLPPPPTSLSVPYPYQRRNGWAPVRRHQHTPRTQALPRRLTLWV